MSGTTKHICQVCGKEFIGRANQKNCTIQCGWRKSSKTYYHKNKFNIKRGKNEESKIAEEGK